MCRPWRCAGCWPRALPASVAFAVPAMPIGSPGMEVPGQAPDTYDVIAFGEGAHQTFMRFRGAEPV